MKALFETIREQLSIPALYEPYLAAVVMLGCAFALVTFASIYSGIFIFFERRIAARMMSRIGPNRVGPQGLFQFIADAVKLIFKEDLIPGAADKPLYKLAPYLMAIGVFAGFAVLPFSHRVIGVDLNIGILYILAITSISVVGVLMAGWASNSKWALFGGMRAAAQIVSYEIPAAMSLMPGVLLAGTMSTQGIIAAQAGAVDAHWLLQGGAPWNWYIFHSPMMFILFFVYFISALAEGSRTPFDLPEADSELVSGYNTEYSGFRFAAYFLAEFANTWIAAAIAVIIFLGGWQIPFVDASVIANAQGGWLIFWEALSAAVFLAKMACLVFVIIQLRWTLPRVRVDQMMIICWKYLLPITFVCSFLMLGWMIIWPWESTGSLAWRFAMTVGGVLLIGLYVRRVNFNITSARDQFYFRVRV